MKSHAPSAWGGAPGVAPKSTYHKITWGASRPEYFVWAVDGVDVRVSGSNFTTYALLRDFEKYEYSVGTRGDVLNATFERLVRNATGDAWVLVPDIERV
ncbi:hypothetical protein J421_5662 (plasmid) [Gemmatirosa kalamazoonensis]|uniref:Uncharacterized protein n=1 Tax=Gemmatirosa kalamazoonensis TaxID=861299 RepID=W0RRX8_9BACT|nr:hypothetical protein [Gemmatirosa kalamazoonensis]AHG93197.1 hypothetical protein J421_5662 [Gemmatirosa kalamazoonensis]